MESTLQKRTYRVYPTLFVFVFITLLAAFILVGCARSTATGGAVVGETSMSPLDIFAKCLTDSGVKMYGAYWCPHCQNQKAMFGESWKYINYVECAIPNERGQTKECTKAGIMAYPTWVFGDGSRVSGEQTFAQLASKSGCKLP
ncbi:MAG: hypothetical protein QXU88_02595 [Candidatus Woesearchaeota archaeon]